MRWLTEADHARLAAYARHLAPEPRAQLLRDEPSGLAEERRRYLLEQAAQGTLSLDRRLTLLLRDLNNESCQLCGWAPRRDYGADLREAHHVRWLSRGGPDTLGNLVWVCPNHHRAIHRLDAPYDFGAAGFVFGATIEPLTVWQHEQAA